MPNGRKLWSLSFYVIVIRAKVMVTRTTYVVWYLTKIKQYNKSKRQWDKKKFNPKYDEDDHRLWVLKSNMGVYHAVIHPSLLPRSNIRCDIFHFGRAIRKKLMSHLQAFSLRQSRSFQAVFNCWNLLVP